MAITAKFLHEDGKPVDELNVIPLDENKIKIILGLKIYDTFSIGTGIAKKRYVVVKKNNRFISSKLTGGVEDIMHFDVTVRAV